MSCTPHHLLLKSDIRAYCNRIIWRSGYDFLQIKYRTSGIKLHNKTKNELCHFSGVLFSMLFWARDETQKVEDILWNFRLFYHKFWCSWSLYLQCARVTWVLISTTVCGPSKESSHMEISCQYVLGMSN